MKKLTSIEIIKHMNNGAILKKNFGVYSYWSLILLDGSIITSLRKGAPQLAKSKINYQIIEQKKDSFSIKLK